MTCLKETETRPQITSRRLDGYASKCMRIGIIGGGLGGLSTALALQNAGFENVVVYECDAHFTSRRDGYGLTLTYNPKGPLAQLGILEELSRLDAPSRCHYVFDPQGHVLGYYGNAFLTNKRGGLGKRRNLRVPRQAVRKIMLNKLRPNTVQWSKRLVHYTDHDNEEKSAKSGVTVIFDDGTNDHLDLLVGADGVRSRLFQTTPAKYMGIFIILGITSDFCHSFLDEQGFYTLDGTRRLFTMPFEGSRMQDCLCEQASRRTMWQFSFRLEDKSQVTRLRKASSQELLDNVLNQTQDWHDPIRSMLLTTPLESVWGTGLMDRVPLPTHSKGQTSRVVVLGDAFHAMSPFKGQGANQALTDGPLLVSWLQKAHFQPALLGFEREMAQRTHATVLASREAAQVLHSPAALLHTEDFVGVNPNSIPTLVNELKSRKIGAHLGSHLDEEILSVIQELKYAWTKESKKYQDLTHEAQNLILTSAALGDLATLRQCSKKFHPCCFDSLRTPDRGESCLFLAAKYGHGHMVQWLLAECAVTCDAIDNFGTSPLDVAITGGHSEIVTVISKYPKIHAITHSNIDSHIP